MTNSDYSFAWPAGRRAAAMISLDLDAESGLLHSNPETAEHLDVMAQLAYGPRMGTNRLLDALDRWGLPATIFTPGFTARRWPDQVLRAVDLGHEIGQHGFLHEYLHDVDERTEREYLERALDAIDAITGLRPIGYRAPGFQLNRRSPGILAEYGFVYDSSLQDSDLPYRLLSEENRQSASVIEIPVQWALDDFAHYMFLPGLKPYTSIASPARVQEMWADEIRAIVECGGVAVFTLHPYLSGRASRAKALEALFEVMAGIPELWVASGRDIAQHTLTQPADYVWHRPIVRSDM